MPDFEDDAPREADEEREPVAVIRRMQQLDGMEDQEADRAHSSLLRPKLQCGCLGVLPIMASTGTVCRIAMRRWTPTAMLIPRHH